MTPLLVRLVVLIAVFASVFLISQVILAYTLNRRSERRAINKRLELLRSGIGRDQVVSILRRNLPRRLSEDSGPIERAYVGFHNMIRTAGLSYDPLTIMLLMAGGSVAAATILLLLAYNSPFPVTTGVVELIIGLAIAIGIGLPLMVLSRLAQRRRKRMEEQFPVALDIFTRALRAGHPIAAAIDLLTKESEDPLGSEFGLVADEVAYGAELNDALQSLADRWGLEDIRMFVISLSVQSETGGNLAEILENLVKVIRDRAALYLKVRALSSEGRMSGWMLTVLPILTFISVFLVSPQFYFSVAGDPVFVYGFSGLIILYFIGLIAIRRIIDLEV